MYGRRSRFSNGKRVIRKRNATIIVIKKKGYGRRRY